MIFIIGGKGLTGSAVVRHLQERNEAYEIIQRENKEEFFGKSCDFLIFANGNALKHKANKEPSFDFHASVYSVAEYIHNINHKKFIHISTVDVYDRKFDEKFTDENICINSDLLEPYSYHKLLAENYIRHYSKDYLIFRLPGLVGEGMKKNPAYDFISNQKKVAISPDSELNFIHTRLVAESIFKIIDLGMRNEIFNLASKNSIKIGSIRNIIGYDTDYTDDANRNIQKYKINTEKIQKHVELTTSEEAIKEYFESL